MTARDVLDHRRRWACLTSDALTLLQSLPTRSISLVFFSPPFEAQRAYRTAFALTGEAWVAWLRSLIREACRVSSGLVCVNASCPVRDFRYSPALEWLVADLTRHDGIVCGPSPHAWVKASDEHSESSGIPGSGKRHYQRRDWESVYSFCLPDRLPLSWSDNTAFGRLAKGATGGDSQRTDAHNRDRFGAHVGSRSGQRTRAGTLSHKPRPGSIAGEVAAICNPGNVIRARSGGHHLGHKFARLSHAAMPVAVVERFVCWYAAPDGIVLDCTAGSHTTGHAAILHGRRYIGCDVDDEMSRVGVRRLRGITPGITWE